MSRKRNRKPKVPMTALHIMMRYVSINPPDNPIDPLEIACRRMLAEDEWKFAKELEERDQEHAAKVAALETTKQDKPDASTAKCVAMAERLLEQITVKKLEAV